jgi:hypothetical protein
MSNVDALTALQKANELRNWCRENFPFYESTIATDLVFFLAIEFVERKPLTVKRFFTSTGHSYTAVRQHYRNLFSDGWLAHTLDGSDKRIKYIVPTTKFMKIIDSYSQAMNSLFYPHPSIACTGTPQ